MNEYDEHSFSEDSARQIVLTEFNSIDLMDKNIVIQLNGMEMNGNECRW